MRGSLYSTLRYARSDTLMSLSMRSGVVPSLSYTTSSFVPCSKSSSRFPWSLRRLNSMTMVPVLRSPAKWSSTFTWFMSASSVLKTEYLVMAARLSVVSSGVPETTRASSSLDHVTMGMRTSSIFSSRRKVWLRNPTLFVSLHLVKTSASSASLMLPLLNPFPYCPICCPDFSLNPNPSIFESVLWSIPGPLSMSTRHSTPPTSGPLLKSITNCVAHTPLSSALSTSSAIAPNGCLCEVALDTRYLAVTRECCTCW
mmetsp:Transcript_15417/g.39018  ORF Transcript_15417/g.39018 Transcript_15417/m.39018 type:complete len:256 (-) Transcript_15417:55-822(-)